jgi:hypothetical protein
VRLRRIRLDAGWLEETQARCADLQARFFLAQVRLMDKSGAPSITWVHLEMHRRTWQVRFF